MTHPIGPTTPETPEKGQNGAQDDLNTRGGQREAPEGENGREMGAQGLGAHNAGPGIREAADQDRRWWNAKYAGEGQ